MALNGGLYIIATPIGNLGDITLRALETLKGCDMIACEDTRVSRKFLSAYGIDKPVMSYHDHNADQMRPLILGKMASGQAVALISDAGTPLISDPGYKLVRQCYEAGLPVTCLPGASAVIAGLVLSGMPTDRFLFGGFADKKTYPELSPLGMTLIFFESAQRLVATLKDMARAFPNRTVAVVREITKLFEEVRRGPFEDLIQLYEEKGPPKGEVVLVLSPPAGETVALMDIDVLLRQALETHSLRDACTLVGGTLNVSRKQVYQRALALREEKQEA
ncbi:MAG: rsmI [Alphaproteobacteria bacterium]|jgi:16S rRNA (cytidine1402-2'-O)-methyltransferase|nr:rsmI [Alphaproteobacteria bacterium]